MKVKIEYTDNESLTVEEIYATARRNYGDMVDVDISPDGSLAYDQICFGVQQLTTHRQVSLIFDKSQDYSIAKEELKVEVLGKLEELLDQVMTETENKCV